MIVLLTNARAQDNKDVDEEPINKEDEEVILKETLENAKDASIDENGSGEDDR